MASSDFGKVSERLSALSRFESGQLMAELIQGPVTLYHDRRYESQ